MDKGLQPSAVFALIILCIVGGYWLAIRAYAVWTRYRHSFFRPEPTASDNTTFDSQVQLSTHQLATRLQRVEHRLMTMEERLIRSSPSTVNAGDMVKAPVNDSMENPFPDAIRNYTPSPHPIIQEEIRQCVRDGLTPEQIARQLNLSRREVTLLLALSSLPGETS